MNRLISKPWKSCLAISSVASYGAWRYYDYITPPEGYKIVTRGTNFINFIYNDQYYKLIKDKDYYGLYKNDNMHAFSHTNNAISYYKISEQRGSSAFYEVKSTLGSNYKIIRNGYNKFVLKDNAAEYCHGGYIDNIELVNEIERNKHTPCVTPEIEKYITHIKEKDAMEKILKGIIDKKFTLV